MTIISIYSSTALHTVWNAQYAMLLDFKKLTEDRGPLSRNKVEVLYSQIYFSAEMILEFIESKSTKFDIDDEDYDKFIQDFTYIQKEAFKSYNDFMVKVA